MWSGRATVLGLVLCLLARTAVAQVATVDPKAALAEGDKAARAKDWSTALRKFTEAEAAQPSARAIGGIANAQYQLHHLAEAYDAYEEFERTYGATLGGAERALVTARLKELTDKTGYLSIRVSESGAAVSIDDTPVGKTPVPALIRVLVGSHKVHIEKEGFDPFDAPADVTANGKSVVDVTLARASSLGRLAVKERSGQAIRVLVDGVDVGATPWEGEVPPGTHDVSGRSPSLYATPVTLNVPRGVRTEVELVAVPASAHLTVKTNDGKGVIYIDGQVKAEGTYAGDVAVGPHVIAVTREGYERFERKVTLADKESYVENVTLRQTGAHAAESTFEGQRPFEGTYGGLELAGLYQVNNQGTELELNCAALGAIDCSTPAPIGGALFAYYGYTWDPVGFEFVLAFLGDTVSQRATFNGTTNSRQVNTPLASPARTEDFSFGSVGGGGAIRVRGTVQGRVLRGSVAAGLGLAVRDVFMKREASTTDGSNLSDSFAPGGVIFFSPAISAEAAGHLRLNQTTAISLGLVLWGDNASTWGSNASSPDPKRYLLRQGAQPVPIPTPLYHYATDSQVFLGTFVGVMFGP